jgi:UDP-N-acetylglucosamine acyltransferase
MAKIDPTARVADGARLAADVEVGPFCLIGPDVEIGEGSKLLSHANVQGHTKIGPRATIYPFASLGTPPQSVHYKGEPSRLIIGADNVIRESVTMNTGTAGARMDTVVADGCIFRA